MALELHPWRFEVEFFLSRLPCGHSHRLIYDLIYYLIYNNLLWLLIVLTSRRLSIQLIGSLWWKYWRPLDLVQYYVSGSIHFATKLNQLSMLMDILRHGFLLTDDIVKAIQFGRSCFCFAWKFLVLWYDIIINDKERHIAQFADDSPGDAISSVYTTETAFGTLTVCWDLCFSQFDNSLSAVMHCVSGPFSSHVSDDECPLLIRSFNRLSPHTTVNSNANGLKKTSKRKRTYSTFCILFLITGNSLEDWTGKFDQTTDI